jgi:hypothetical protein
MRRGREVAVVQKQGDADLWFWYGDGINSLLTVGARPLEECRRDVKRHFAVHDATSKLI